MTEQPMSELMKPEARVRILSFSATVAKFRRGVLEAVEQSNSLRAKREEANKDKSEHKTMAAAAAAAAAQTTSSTSSKTKAAKKW